jgi:oxalate---CoA ligase
MRMKALHPSPTISMLLREQAKRQPDAPAVLAPGRSPLDFAGLWAQVQHVADSLSRYGLTPSARVAVALPNGPEMATAFLGVAACAACVPLNPGYQAAEFRSCLMDVGAQAVIVPRGDSGALLSVAKEMGLLVLEIEADASLAAGHFRIGPPPFDALESKSLAQSEDIALILRTSGTTARPKIVALSQATLLASVRELGRHFALSPTDRCLNVRPLFHIAGLVGCVLASVASGGSVVCTPGIHGDEFFDWIAQYEPTWYSAVPTMHQWVVARGALYRQRAPKHRFRFVHSASSPLASVTSRSLEELTGAPVIESYGMTEATPIAINPLPPGLRKPGSVGLPTGVVEVALMDEAGQLLSAGSTGEIVLKGPRVTAGCERESDASPGALVDGWFRTGDQGRFDDDGYLHITGRLKEIINRGGEKISAREIDEALLEHPDVLQAAACAVAHATLGQDLVAAVVLRDGASVQAEGLRRFLFERLAQFKVPSTIVLVDSLPLGATSKVQRAELQEKLAHLLANDFVSPRTDLERSLETSFCEALGCAQISLHDSFFTLGGDSLTAAKVIARINARHGVELTLATLFRFPTIGALAIEIEAAKAAIDDVAETLVAEIAQLSDEEVARLLASEDAAASDIGATGRDQPTT